MSVIQMSDTSRVFRRKVFYIPGYDPFPARRYRELYRTESGEQADLSGYDIDISANPDSEGYGWNVTATIDGQSVKTDYEILAWSDLVQDSMSTGIVGTYIQMVWVSWVYISSGALRSLTWLRKGPVIAALYPIVGLILQLVFAIVAANMAGNFVGGLLWAPLKWAVTIPLFVYLMRFFKRMDHKFFIYYLMNDYAFSAGLNGANPPALDDRLKEFKRRIAAALQTDLDEVLVVGHSSGAHLAVDILAEITRDGFVRRLGPKLGFLSLGQVIPMISFLPDAGKLRANLHDLSMSPSLTWIDVTAPGDGCSFALCDPVSVTGVAPATKRWPLVVSAAFSQTLSDEKWRYLKHRYFRLHFQYLCAFDRPGDYDYFQITAGPKTLAERYDGRQPSKSRIDVPASLYRSMAA